MRGFAPRFALEAGFLILLGVGAGYADLRPAVIVAIVGGGWLLVALVELGVWRAQGHAAVVPAPPLEIAEDAPAPEPEPEPELEPAEEDRDYPLRADAGDGPSEEVEAYTRVIGARSEPDEDAAGDAAAP
jgi:hypothetical protein